MKCNMVELWQTPTFVSYMCAVDARGIIHYKLSGKAAQHALNIYLRWVKGKCPCDEVTVAHVKELQDALRQPRRLKVSIL